MDSNQSEIRYGIYPPPKSTHKKVEPHAATIPVEPLRAELIDHVEVYEHAPDLLDERVRGLATEDALISLAVTNSPRGDMLRQTYGGGGRTIPTAYGYIPYDDRFVGGEVIEKGLLSGDVYHITTMQPGNRTPWGLVGRTSAEFQMRMTDRLLEFGVRASCPLGIIVPKLKEYRRVLVDGYYKAGQPRIADVLAHSFSILKQNNDEPVLLFHVVDVNDRLGTNLAIKPPSGKAEYHRMKLWHLAQVARAARLFIREAELFPAHFEEYLIDTELSRDAAIGMLTTISARKRPTRLEADQFTDFSVGVVGANAEGIRRMEEDAMRTKNWLPEYFGGVLALTKDTTDGYVITDLEEAGARDLVPTDRMGSTTMYTDLMSGYLNIYLRGLCGAWEVGGYVTNDVRGETITQFKERLHARAYRTHV